MGPVCTIMVGRLDDWLKVMMERAAITTDPGHLEWAGVAVFKKAYSLFRERGYRLRLLSAAFRNHMHWSELIGGDVVISPPCAWQKRFAASDIAVAPRIDTPVAPAIVDDLYRRFPDFRRAYDPDGLTHRRVRCVCADAPHVAAVPRRVRRPVEPGARRHDSESRHAMIPPGIRLTMAQALVRFLGAQSSERDGRQQPFFGGVFGIFGHGNVAGIGQALDQAGGPLRYYQCRNEQAMVHTAAAFAKMSNRLRTLACTTSIGPGATNMITGAAGATINRLPVLLLPGDVFANRVPAPVLQQLESPQTQDVSVNDCFRPVSRYWDRIFRAEQLLTALPEAMRVLDLSRGNRRRDARVAAGHADRSVRLPGSILRASSLDDPDGSAAMRRRSRARWRRSDRAGPR